jgi:DNA-binding transcriptional LysR family regulator
MDRFEAMRVFTAVAEGGGFAAASRALGLSPPAVTRAVAALEERVGTRLLTRTTRVVRLTEAGTRYLADCKRILGEVEEAEASAAGAHAEPRGTLNLTASVMFGRQYVAPILFDFLAQHPKVVVRAMLLDRIVDMMEEGIDVAVRIAHLPNSGLSAVRVGQVRRVVCGSPDYLAAHGTPRTLEDLARHEAAVFAPGPAAVDWNFAGPGGRGMNVQPRTQLIVNTVDMTIAAALAGRGLARVLSYQVADELQAGRLKIVLEAFEPPPLPIHIVHLEGRRAAARVRAFVDFAVERLRANAALQ